MVMCFKNRKRHSEDLVFLKKGTSSFYLLTLAFLMFIADMSFVQAMQDDEPNFLKNSTSVLFSNIYHFVKRPWFSLAAGSLLHSWLKPSGRIFEENQEYFERQYDVPTLYAGGVMRGMLHVLDEPLGKAAMEILQYNISLIHL